MIVFFTINLVNCLVTDLYYTSCIHVVSVCIYVASLMLNHYITMLWSGKTVQVGLPTCRGHNYIYTTVEVFEYIKQI